MNRRRQDGARAEPVQVVHDLLRPLRRHHRPHRHPPFVVQRRDGRRLQPRRERHRPLQVLDAAVVVHHHVAAGDEDALEAAQEALHARVVGLRAGAADDDGLGGEDRFADDFEARVAQRRARLDDVGDDLGDTELDGGLDGAVEVDDGGVDPGLFEVLGDDALVRGRDGEPGEVLGALRGAGAGREAEGGAGEAERQDLLGVGARVEEEVAPGDADVETARTHVEGDVAGAQVEELDLVGRVDQDEFLLLGALAVAGLMEHRRRRSGEGTLVGQGDAQHDGDVLLWVTKGGGPASGGPCRVSPLRADSFRVGPLRAGTRGPCGRRGAGVRLRGARRPRRGRCRARPS
ncbi:putative ATP phosphoribosyltransferase [Streptomyces sp. Tu6071]|nr:putative ATP phosphoribosyltransferase [Streptomyces sp. Tu6071]